MSRTMFTRVIAQAAGRYDLDADLVEALVLVESSGNPWAFRPEAGYRYLWNVATRSAFRDLRPDELASRHAPDDFPRLAGSRDQEWILQAASLGLMQIMGAVAREGGFMGEYLGELFDPEVNLDYGCRHLARLFRRADGGEALALGAYNAGWGGATKDVGIKYAGKVLRTRVGLQANP